MERSPLITLAVVGVVAILVMAGMYLFSLNQIADTGTAQIADDIDESLSRSLVPGAKPRVTMRPDGPGGLDAPRRYVVRYQPSEQVSRDPKALERLAERVAEIVVAGLGRVRAPVTVHCVGELPGGSDIQRAWRRVGGEDSSELVAVQPVPPLERESSADGAGEPDEQTDSE